ncbi:TPA: hypothetical protein N0F65_002815 [Lagenidium giganteum]|uniref:No apical meristem-associated C-terminal domain-containing protein n=1 Tax=Lagenidium giganteum TaxID=4803 RepID=A0AAV2ZCW8_9STRA|nr:TPA: hypothetical protein N0F65_002815 [Lagenidium giganteum]
MGKKTNWTVAEDQALCRAWLNANEAGFPQPLEQKAATFWSVVHGFFHAEVETSVERPQNGLKIRFSRINRDVQKFAVIYDHLNTTTSGARSAAASAAELVPGQSAAAVANGDASEATERALIDEAKELFHNKHDTKFLFEQCWRILRYSPKWNQLLSNSVGAASTTLHGNDMYIGMDGLPRDDDAVSVASAVEQRNAPANASKRRAMMSPVDFGRAMSVEQMQVASEIAKQLRRQNELLEDRNAIALFRSEELLDDEEAQDMLDWLKQKYVKRIRLQRATAAAQAAAVSPLGDDTRGETKVEPDNTATATVATADAIVIGVEPPESDDNVHEQNI